MSHDPRAYNAPTHIEELNKHADAIRAEIARFEHLRDISDEPGKIAFDKELKIWRRNLKKIETEIERVQGVEEVVRAELAAIAEIERKIDNGR
jgi:predicted  nucleic acid-binding Zn-ribbon protein